MPTQRAVESGETVHKLEEWDGAANCRSERLGEGNYAVDFILGRRV